MFFLNPNSGVPIYVQLQQQFQQRILSGQLVHGTQLPSVRELSAELGINPLTAAKVYQILEREGFVETKRGLGTYVAHQSPALKIDALRRQIGPALDQLVAEALHLGLGEKDILALLSEKFRQFKTQTRGKSPYEYTPILVQNISRSFDGKSVIKDLSFSVEPGSIYGLLGRNGSGKTTALRMLVGLIKPQAGTVRIMGNDPFIIGAEERQWLGYMSEKAIIPSTAKVSRVLKLGRELYPSWDSALADSLLAKYNLLPGKRYSALSQGQQRLLGFIMAIAPRPKVLLLDEPAANLDVVARREILDDILELIRDCGCTVVFSTHILSDVERVADQIGILSQGNLRVSESIDSLKDSIRQVRFFGFKNGVPKDEIPESFRTIRGRDDVTLTLRTHSLTTPETLAQRWSCQQETRALSLEDIFIELSRN